jgi:hypothetical protein
MKRPSGEGTFPEAVERPRAALALALGVAAALAVGGCKQEPTIVIHFQATDLASAGVAGDGGAKPGPRAAVRPRSAADEMAPSPEDEGPCTADGDCATVKADCCGCTSGGAMRPILRSRVARVESVLARRCAETMCGQLMSSHESCRKRVACRSGRCVLVDQTR